ncbi:MAG: PorV/PorQ family protein [Candidatus Desantisbacteria bacterium]
MKKLICAFIIVICSAIVSHAATKYSGLPGEYLQWGTGARAMGMGGAFAGLSDDVSAIYFNPAGLTQIKSGQATAMASNLFEGSFYNFLGFAHPSQKTGVLGLGVVLLSSGDLEETNIRQETLGKFNDSRQGIFVSYGKRIARSISCGASVKLVSQQISSYNGTGIGLDGGLFLTPRDRLSLGLSLKNIISPKLRLKEEEEKFPFSLSAGLGSRMLNNNLILCMDVDKTLGQSLHARIGGEYWLRKKTIALRIGVDGSKLNAGFGIKRDKYGFDYALGFADIGVSHRLSFTWSFDTFGIQITPEPDVFSPTGKFNQTRIKIQAKQLEKIKRWSLTIFNKWGNNIRYFEGNDDLPPYVIWNGRDEKQQIVSDGEYVCVLEIMDKLGETFKSVPESVFIVTTTSDVSIPMEIGE